MVSPRVEDDGRPLNGHGKSSDWYFSLSIDDRILFRQRVYDHVARYQASTLSTAIRHRERWTEEEDAELWANAEQMRFIAIALGRTYHAGTDRLHLLRVLHEQGLRPEYGEDTDTGSVQTLKPHRILCPCGSTDGDHDEWCPSR